MSHVSYKSSNKHGLSVRSDMSLPRDEARKRRRVLLGVELLESRITLSRLTLLPLSLPSVAVGQNCQVAFSATNGDGHYSYTLASGKLPKGLGLSKGGVLHGEPKVGGTYHFSVKVTESSRRRPSASRSFSLTVNRASTTGPVSEFSVSAPTAATAGTVVLVKVTAKDASGNTVTGFNGGVTLTSSDGQPVNLLSPLVFNNGTAEATITLDRADLVTLTATSGTIQGTSGSTIDSPAAASTFVVSAPSTATAGSGFAVTVTAKDAFGNTVSDFQGSVTFTCSDGQPVIILPSPVFNDGTAVATVTLDMADTLTLTATSATIQGTSGSIIDSPAAASTFVVNAPSTATAGSGFAVTVTAKDAFGNTVSDFQGSVTLTCSDGQPVIILPSPVFNDGTAMATVTLDMADTLTLTATSATIQGTSGSIIDSPAAASTFVVNAPSTATAGTGFAVTVTARDAFGNTATGFDDGVTLTSSDGQPVKLLSPLVFNDGTAVATITLDMADTLTLTATSGTIQGTSGCIIDSPAAASLFVVSAPSTATAGTGFAVTVTAEDAFGNTLSDFQGSVTLTCSDGQPVIILSSPVFNNGTAVATVALNTADTVMLTAASGTINGASGAITVGGGGVTSDWFGQNMTDPGLQDLARRDFSRDDSLTYNDMLNLFAEAESAGPVTGAELQSLQVLVTTGGAAAVNMSGSVQSLTYKVADGDPANAQFLGEPLGNLGVGSSATQLQDLVDKWFLGMDHPTIDMQYLSGWSVNYALASGTLFGNGGPSYKDVYQGEEGDCWLLASAAETAAIEPSVIQSMFTDDGTTLERGVQVHIWTVRFYDNGVASYLTVDNYLPAWDGDFVYANLLQPISNSSNVLWVPLLEKAYAQLCESGWSESYLQRGSNAYASLNGGLAMDTLPVITGAQESSSYPFGDASSFISAISSGTLLTLSSITGNSSLGIVGDHDYAVLGYNASNQTFTLLNPWGWNNGGAPGIINLTWEQITQYFSLDGDCNPVSSVSLTAPSATTFALGNRPRIRTVLAPTAGSPDSSWFTGTIFTSGGTETGTGPTKGL